MNYTYENYLYIYNIKLMEENTLLIKKITFKHVLCFIYYKNFFINSIKHVFFFYNKNCFQKLFSKTVFKNNNKTYPWFFLRFVHHTILNFISYVVELSWCLVYPLMSTLWPVRPTPVQAPILSQTILIDFLFPVVLSLTRTSERHSWGRPTIFVCRSLVWSSSSIRTSCWTWSINLYEFISVSHQDINEFLFEKIFRDSIFL